MQFPRIDSLFPSISISSQNLTVLNPPPAKLIPLSSNDRSLSLLDADATTTGPNISAVDLLQRLAK
jgi:hypothetical protein